MSAMPVPSFSVRVAAAAKDKRDERIMRVRVALGQFAAAREWRAPADRDVRVLADEQRLEAARFERARQLGDLDAVIGRKMKNANAHAQPPSAMDRLPQLVVRSIITAITGHRAISIRSS